LRVAGKGNSGQNNGQPGDLIIKLKIKEDTKFIRDNYDVTTNEYISLVDAVLGCEINVQLIDGTQKVQVPPGTQHGHKIKI
jgi:molecular chaperone DnaJ